PRTAARPSTALTRATDGARDANVSPAEPSRPVAPTNAARKPARSPMASESEAAIASGPGRNRRMGSSGGCGAGREPPSLPHKISSGPEPARASRCLLPGPPRAGAGSVADRAVDMEGLALRTESPHGTHPAV